MKFGKLEILFLVLFSIAQQTYGQEPINPEAFANSISVVKGHFGNEVSKTEGKVLVGKKEIDGIWHVLAFNIDRDLKSKMVKESLVKIEVFEPKDEAIALEMAIPFNETLIVLLQSGASAGSYRIAMEGRGWLIANPIKCIDIDKVGEVAMTDEILNVLDTENFKTARNERIQKLMKAGNNEKASIDAINGQQDLMIKSAVKAAVAFNISDEIVMEKLNLLQTVIDKERLFPILRQQIELGDIGAMTIAERMNGQGSFSEMQGASLPFILEKGVKKLAQDQKFIELKKLYFKSSAPIKLAILRQSRNEGKIDPELCIPALDDNDLGVRYQAIYSLSRLFPASGIKLAMVPTFNSDPEYYVNEWKTWISKNPSLIKSQLDGVGSPLNIK